MIVYSQHFTQKHFTPQPATSERWASILDYPDYQVSDQGRVRSFKSGAPRILKASSKVGLTGPEGQKFYEMRVLVAQAFLNATPQSEIIHLNGNRKDCRAANLKVVPPADPPEPAKLTRVFWRPIPNFSKYLVSTLGEVQVRETGELVSLQTGGAVWIKHDDGAPRQIWVKVLMELAFGA